MDSVVCIEIRTKHINTLRGKSVECLIVKPGGKGKGKIKVKVKFTLEQPTKAHRGSRGIAVLFL